MEDLERIDPSLAVARKAFLGLVQDIRPQLHRYCARMTGSALDGEDLVQDTLATAYYKLSLMNQEIPLRAWLFKIAHNKCIDFLRLAHPHEEWTVEGFDEGVPFNDEIERLEWTTSPICSTMPSSRKSTYDPAREAAGARGAGFFIGLHERMSAMVLYAHPLYTFDFDASKKLLRMTWPPATASMRLDDFKEALHNLAGFAHDQPTRSILVDVRQFRFRPPAELGNWRDEVISPRLARSSRRIAGVPWWDRRCHNVGLRCR
jgi:RNA polymerase sigma factor (sigma-70 family)